MTAGRWATPQDERDMKAVYYEKHGPVDVLKVGNLPVPPIKSVIYGMFRALHPRAGQLSADKNISIGLSELWTD